MINRQQMGAAYTQHRQNFSIALKQAGGSTVAHQHPDTGPNGEALYLDLGFVGNPNAQQVVMISSGTHGIEGYLGSFLQTQLLGSGLLQDFLASHQIIFAHAVNPYGMAWFRRVNENNVDLNRNFLTDYVRLPNNVDYDLLSADLNPAVYDVQTLAKTQLAMNQFAQQYGGMHYFKTVSGGQYHNPQGVQFGGQKRQWSTALLSAIWQQYLAHKKQLLHIDLHTGLGEKGVGLVMVNADDDEPKRLALINKHWPNSLISPRPKPDDSIMSGVLGNLLEASLNRCQTLAMVLEFGTVEMQQVAQAMIADNWLHQYGDMDTALGQTIKQQISDAFYICDASYLAQTQQRMFEVVAAALAISVD